MAHHERASSHHNFPRVHNAMWPGLVGKGPDSEPPIDLDTMLRLTAAAHPDDADGARFDGVDLFLFDPHVSIDASDDDLARLADEVRALDLVVGSVVAPVWPPTGGGSAMGSAEERQRFVAQVRKACRIARKLRELGARPYGIVRIDSAASPAEWAKDPDGNTRLIAQTFREACEVAAGTASAWRPKARSAGAACIAGGAWCSFWNWWTVRKRWASRRTWRTRCSSRWATTRRKIASCRRISSGGRPIASEALRELTAALRPWTIDFHVAQNDAHRAWIGIARQDRPPLPARRPQRQARHRARRRPLAAR
jgi:hypothetical protein